MQVTTEQLFNAVEKWVQNDLVNKGTAWQKAMATFLFLQCKPKLQAIVSSMSSLSDNGTFESSDLHTNFSAAISSAGGNVPIPLLGYKFDKADLDQVFNYLEKQS